MGLLTLPYHGLPLARDGRPPRRPRRHIRVAGPVHRGGLSRRRRPLSSAAALEQLLVVGPQLVHLGLQPLVVLLQQLLRPHLQLEQLLRGLEVVPDLVDVLVLPLLGQDGVLAEGEARLEPVLLRALATEAANA